MAREKSEPTLHKVYGRPNCLNVGPCGRGAPTRAKTARAALYALSTV
jgi:hypothetical protein